MAPILFAHTLTLDGRVYDANRQPDPQLFGRVQTPTRSYAPKVASSLADVSGGVQLDPAAETTWHRGAMASRPVVPGMYAWTRNGWTCDPGMVLPGPLVTQVPLNYTAAVPVSGIWEQDGDLWIVAGRYVNRLAGGSSFPTADKDLGVGIIASAASLDVDGGVIVSLGYATGGIWQRPAGGSWVQASGSPLVQRSALGRVFWTTGGVTAESLVGQTSARGIRYTRGADPKTDANWFPAAEITVGPYPIQSFITTLDHLYIATTGGIRDLDETGLAPNLTPEAEQMIMSTNGVASIAAGGWLYANYGYGLLRVQVTGTLNFAHTQWVTPGAGLPNETPVSGYGTALVRRGDWLIYALFDPTAYITYICWGREPAPDEPGPFTWHVAPIVLSGQKVTAMHVSGLVSANPRLWMATIDQSNVVSAWWAPLALSTPYQDIRQGRAYRCATSFDLYTTVQDWGDPSIPKDYEEEALEGEAISPSSNLLLAVAADNSPTYTTVGTFSQGDRVVLPTSSAFVANRVQAKITGTGLSASPPILRKRESRAFPAPEERQLRAYQLRIGRAISHAGGSFEGQDTSVRIAHLESLQLDGTRASMIDENGGAVVVKVRPGTLKFTETDNDEDGPTLIASLQLMVMSSINGGGSSAALDNTSVALDSQLWRLD